MARRNRRTSAELRELFARKYRTHPFPTHPVPVCVYYTADLIVPDGSDTDVYGDACETGHGAELQSGWYSPDWSRSDVYENREDVHPDTFDNDGDTARWVADTLGDRLGHVELGDAGGETFYASDSFTVDYRTGVDCRMAAHVSGLTSGQLARVWRLCSERQTGRPLYV